MLSYEKYLNNVKIHDKYNIRDIKINKSIVYNGNLDLLSRKNVADARIPPLAAAIVGVNNTSVPLPTNLDFTNIWSDIDAQEAYLNTKPTCYLILGKPGLGSYTLGENLSKKLNNIHLSSRNVILDEIEQKSPTGKCLDFNMRHNKICKFDHILAIMQKKIQSSVVKHRGFVISGLPLVTSSEKEKSLLDSLYTEESLEIIDDLLYDMIWNLKRKKPKQKKITLSTHSSITSEGDKLEEENIEEEQEPEIEPEEGEEEEEQVVEMPKYMLDSCSNIVTYRNMSLTTKKAILLKQAQELFNFKPDVIIHIMSPDIDTVTKKSRKFFNYLNNVNTFHSFVIYPDLELRWPNKYTMIEYSKPYEFYIFNPKYNCKQPINFKYDSVNQICNYKNNISGFLEEKLKDFNSKYILKVDGRTSIHQMLNYIMGKLLMIPVKPVLIPKPMYIEEPPEDMDEFWTTVKELNNIKSGILNFNRFVSPWYNRCPVELQNRHAIQGKPKLAVYFFNRVFLLSTLDALISFCKDPQPYLKIEYLEPTCRVIITGTKSSGKTMIAKCLSWLFDTDIICYDTFLNKEKEKKYHGYCKTILSEIIPTIEDARLLKWETEENERTSNLNKWFTSNLNFLKSYVALLDKSSKLAVKQHLPDAETKKMERLKKKLSFLQILDDLELCEDLILDKNLLNYAPIELVTETLRPKVPVLGDEDVTEAISAYIVANDLQKDIEPSAEELVNELGQILFNNDKKSMLLNKKLGKFIIDGFPSDPEYWTCLGNLKLLPDYTISLIENREMDIELLTKYYVIDKSYKEYEERYLLSHDPLVKLKQRSVQFLAAKELICTCPKRYTVVDVEILIIEILNNAFCLIYGKQDFPEILPSFTEAIDTCREQWESAKLKLEEQSKATIIVEIENKNDVELLDEVLLKLRQCYYFSCTPSESAEIEDNEDDYNISQDLLTYNDSVCYGETNIYCPFAYNDKGVLWEGKSEFCTEYDNKSYYFSKEECRDTFQKDVTKYQYINKPLRLLPPVRICVVGTIGSGKTTLSKQIAKELGLMHVDFAEFINSHLIPKHFKKVGWQHENAFKDIPKDDETVTEFQLDEENVRNVTDILFNENEIRRIIHDYFEKGVPLMSALIQKLTSLLWFTEPFSRIGFVLDGFPKLLNDVEDMVAFFCIPDLIIDITGSSEKTLQRLSPIRFKKWKMQLHEAKTSVKKKFEKEHSTWLNSITKEIVIKLVIDEVLENTFLGMSVSDVIPETETSNQSAIIDANPSGLINVDPKLFKLYNELIQDNPEPVDQSQWEKSEDAQERINSRLESVFEIDDENIQTVKDILSEHKIKNESVNGNMSATRVFQNILPTLSPLRNRTSSFFEQTFIISCDIAETLLNEGFYFISKFNRMCPVYIYENSHAITNLYNICKRMNTIYPVIHRSYIYFINSMNSVHKFRRDPIKYILCEAINSYREYPLRLGIIGPAKSGKSELASKLAKRYGLMCISRGQAIRHILQNMEWTDIATKIKAKLELGECIDSELIMNAVHTLTIDHRVVTNGFVFDGFPDIPAEASELIKLGLYPLIIIEINSSSETILKNSQQEVYYPLLKQKPPYSRSYIEYRNSELQKNYSNIKEWINNDIQNLYTISGDSSKWQCLHDAKNCIEDIISKVNYYLLNVETKIVPAGVMCISNEMFEKKMSAFKNLCPICLGKNILRHSAFPVDKKGLVQFNYKFYWFCTDHLDLGLAEPYVYLQGHIKIPEIPVAVKTISPVLLYESGICMVTYTENLPSQKIVTGDGNLAASYRGKYYLFCNLQCMQKFMAKPHLYYDITIFKETSLFPKLSLKDLPDLGYLEQTLGNILTKACCSITVTRPKYPGLNISVSGLLQIALYLKINNPVIADDIKDMYEKVYRFYEARCKLIHDISCRMRSMDNPFVKYPQRCSPRRINLEVAKFSSLISASPSVGSEFNLKQ